MAIGPAPTPGKSSRDSLQSFRQTLSQPDVESTHIAIVTLGSTMFSGGWGDAHVKDNARPNYNKW